MKKSSGFFRFTLPAGLLRRINRCQSITPGKRKKAGAEAINTVTCMQKDGTQLVYTQHFLKPDDPKIGRLSIHYENGIQYVEDYKVLPYEEWVDGHYNKHCKDNINRIVKVYGPTGTQIFEFSF